MNAIFDKKALYRHRRRAAKTLPQHSFLHKEIGIRLLERLEDIHCNFKEVLVSGFLGVDLPLMVPFMAETVVANGLFSEKAVFSSCQQLFQQHPKVITFDAEFLPFSPQSFDLIISCLELHWCNDLVGALINLKKALKPNGLFLAALLGGDTLIELRQALTKAEIQERGGISPRFSPVLDVSDGVMLLQRAGFALPVVDTHKLTATYSSLPLLLKDLQGMGETNKLLRRPKGLTSSKIFTRAESCYREAFSNKLEFKETLPATFQVIYLTGWGNS